MDTTTTLRPSWSSTLAYITAAALTLASAGTNVTSAVTRYPDLSAKIIAGTIAGAVAVLVSLALAAALQSLSRRQWATSLVCAIAFLLAASFSITAALGTLGGARLQSSLTGAHTETSRAKIEADRRKTADELATAQPARNAAELTPEIARIAATAGVNGCAQIDGPVTRQWCPVLAGLQAELARAQRRSALEGMLTRHDAALKEIGAPRLANPDAETLAHVLAAFGVQVSADRLNVALIVLAVAILECGGGLALAVGGALKLPAQPIMLPLTVHPEHAEPTGEVSVALASADVNSTEQRSISSPGSEPGTTGVSGDATPCNKTTRGKVLALIHEAGGTVRLEQRSLARTLGVAPSTVNRAIAALQADGAVKVRTSATGSVLALA